MQLKDLSRTLVRRWYLSLIGALATAGLVYMSLQLVPPTYEVTADVVLLPPETSVGPDGNPYLYLGGLDQAVDVLTRAMTSDSARAEVLEQAGDGDFEVTPDWTTSGPILIVTAQGTTASLSSANLSAVLELVPKTLVALQTTLNVPSDSQITSMVLTEDDEPSAVLKTRLRAVAGSAIVGLVLSGLLIGLIDGLLASRTQRRKDLSAASAAPDVTPSEATAAEPEPEPERSASAERSASTGEAAESSAEQELDESSAEQELASMLVVPHQLAGTSRLSTQD